MLRRFFTDHPATLDESYFEHFAVALRFGGAMLAGGGKVLVHAIIPGLFERAGSDTVRKLNAIMVEHRARHSAAGEQMRSVDWVI